MITCAARPFDQSLAQRFHSLILRINGEIMESCPIEMLVKYSVGTNAADVLEAKRLTCQTHRVLIGKTMLSLLSPRQGRKMSTQAAATKSSSSRSESFNQWPWNFLGTWRVGWAWSTDDPIKYVMACELSVSHLDFIQDPKVKGVEKD